MNADGKPVLDPTLGQRFDAAKTPADFLAVWLASPLLSPKSQKLVDDYYLNFRGMRSARMRHWYNRQLSEADALLDATPTLRVLEIGVGTGTEFTWWAHRGVDVTGIDAFDHCLSATKERFEVLQRATGRQLNGRLVLAPLLTFEDAQGFDLIWMEQVFHHLEPRPQSVERIVKLLRPGDRVILSEANAFNPLLQLQLFRARGFTMTLEVPSEHGTVIYGNERVLRRGTLARWFRKYGVEEESSGYFRMFPSHPIFDPLFGLEKSVSSALLAPLFTHYNFVGRKGM